jgi:uncharacterized membrane protein YhiD involved in acid resistance
LNFNVFNGQSLNQFYSTFAALMCLVVFSVCVPVVQKFGGKWRQEREEKEQQQQKQQQQKQNLQPQPQSQSQPQSQLQLQS